MTLVTLPSSTTTVIHSSQICQAQLALSEAMFCHPVTSLSFMYLSTVPRTIFLMILPGTRWDWLACNYPDLSVFLFLKIGAIFSFSKSVGTSLNCHDFWNIMDSCLKNSSTSSPMTHRCIWSVPWTFAPSGSLVSLLIFSYSRWEPLLLHPVAWSVWLKHLLVKTKAKK